ncbi:MAG: adenylosuccinate synthetase [Candidatus Altiarchaeota archaeon]|nr:adenylosuccinate synthetase [Candidatus Altiarchaeota archaeon]
MTTIVVGGHFGDEGKGKIISYLALKDRPDIIARAGVGPNAGHTVYWEGREYGLRMIPCGFVNEASRLLVGAGVLVDPKRFQEEVKMTGTEGRIFVDSRCAVIEQRHKEEDAGDKFLHTKVGTTGSGCGPANAERAHRTIKLARDFPELREYLADVPLEVNSAIDSGKEVLVEASQGFGLSLFYGTYPYVTSKDTSAGMAAVDVGIGPTKVDDVLVIYKAYTTRVGEGPQNTLITEENISQYPLWQEVLGAAEKKGIKGSSVNDVLAKYLGEKGTVTQRQRRIGDFDLELAKYSAMVNGATQIGITCLDKIFPECNGVREYHKLSHRARDYVRGIEDGVGIKATLISTGPNPGDIVDLRV